jgi:hypothetical protein
METFSRSVKLVVAPHDGWAHMNVDYKACIERLAVPHHAGAPYRALLGAGFDALTAIGEGLHHENAEVRHRCCLFLDHFVTQEVMDDLVTMLDDPDPRVRCCALHALG